MVGKSNLPRAPEPKLRTPCRFSDGPNATTVPRGNDQVGPSGSKSPIVRRNRLLGSGIAVRVGTDALRPNHRPGRFRRTFCRNRRAGGTCWRCFAAVACMTVIRGECTFLPRTGGSCTPSGGNIGWRFRHFGCGGFARPQDRETCPPRWRQALSPQERSDDQPPRLQRS